MSEFSRQEQKALRNLSAKIYEVELGLELKKLHQDFTEWAEGKLNAFELDEKVHRFHSGAHRSLFVLYQNRSRPTDLVARGLARGYISKDEVPKSIIDKLESLISLNFWCLWHNIDNKNRM